MLKFITILLSLFTLCFSQTEVEKNYGKLNNSELLDKFTGEMKRFILLNGGSVNTGMHEELVGITYLKYPATIVWSTVVHTEKYKTDMLLAIKSELKRKGKSFDEQKVKNKLNGQGFIDYITKNTKEKTINQACSRDDYLYILNRDIDIDYVYSDKNYKQLFRININKNICENVNKYSNSTLDFIKQNDKNTIIKHITKDTKNKIKISNGKLYFEPTIYIIDIKSTKNSINYIYEQSIDELVKTASNTKDMKITEDEFKKLVLSDKFIKKMSENIKHKSKNLSCNIPLYREILDKGIDLVYTFYYDNGVLLGRTKVTSSDCNNL